MPEFYQALYTSYIMIMMMIVQGLIVPLPISKFTPIQTSECDLICNQVKRRSQWIRVRPNLITGIPCKKREMWTHRQRRECHVQTDRQTQRENITEDRGRD